MPYFKSECRPTDILEAIWNNSCGDPKQDNYLEFQEWLDLRDRCRKDLFFLTKNILGWTRLIERVHQPVCDFFGKLDFDGVYHEDYTLEEVQKAIAKQDPQYRESLLLDPRGCFKSTINGANCVRFLLNAPDARIFIVTAEYDNAVSFLQQIKKYFYQPDGVAATPLQQLFPEYVLTSINGYNESPLQCPARVHTQQKEPSLWVNAVSATLASQHCDLKIGDDVVSDRNSNSPEARKKLKDKYDNVANLLDEWGYEINIGTRYAVDDYYGSRLKLSQDDAPLRYFCRAAWTVKAEFLDVPIKELQEHMVELLFPEKLSWSVLRKKLLNNERDFRCQQLNEPQQDEGAIHFSEDVLRNHLGHEIPNSEKGEVFITLDSALTSTDKADYSAFAVGRIDRDRTELHILEIVFGRWKQSELAYQIVDLCRRYNPRSLFAESIGGTELLQQEIHRQAHHLQTEVPIYWRRPDNSPNAKANRIKGLETLLTEDRLFFAPGPWIDETFQQFIRYTGLRKNKGRKDDIPDAVSMLQFFLPSRDKPASETEEMKKAREEAERKEAIQAYYRHVFHRDMNVPPTQAEPTQKVFRKSRFDLRRLGQ